MQRTTWVAIILTFSLGVALWQRHDLAVAKAAPLFSTYTVTTTADSGAGSLRQALADANLSLGTDTITFDAAVFAVPNTITLTSGELAINDSVTITGPGSSVLTISANFNSRIFAIGSGNYNVTLSGLTVTNGRQTAPGGGGGILNSSAGTLTLMNCEVSSNSVSGAGSSRATGGGILNAGNGAVTLINCDLSENSAYGLAGTDTAYAQGGGLFNAGNGTVTITDSVLSGNLVNGAVFGFGLGFGEGGGILNAGNGTVTVTNTTLSSNSARGSLLPGTGGGIFNASTGTVNIVNSTLSDNIATGSQGLGGGIANADGTLRLTNSTLSSNSGTGGGIGKGGGVYNGRTGTVTLTNSSVNSNSVSGLVQSEGGGIFSEATGTVNARNSLIASNSSTILAPDVRATVSSQGHNLIGNGTGSSGFSGAAGDQVGTSGSPINPLLAPLGNNGGPTQTRALLPGSPAIDTGDNCVSQNPGCLTTPLSSDQRGTGFLRNSGAAVDIGAFEVQPVQYEGDVAPRPSGNGSLSLADWVQTGRFAVGLDPASVGSEFQRADCAPRDTSGNGVLSLADWVQAGRYAAHLDPPTIAGGPNSPAAGLVPNNAIGMSNSAGRPDNRSSSIVVMTSRMLRSPDTSVAVWLASRGTENAISFSVSFDPSKWELVRTQVDPGVVGAILIENSSQIKSGRVGMAVAMPPGQALDPGWRQLVDIRFRPLPGSEGTATPIETSSDEPVRREVVDLWGNAVAFDWLSSRTPRR
jgi:hypothetical protein